MSAWTTGTSGRRHTVIELQSVLEALAVGAAGECDQPSEALASPFRFSSLGMDLPLPFVLEPKARQPRVGATA